ncbi:MAG: hypothetical protein ACKVPX_04455 [Myxococcaceae bacterium]
MSIRGSTGHSRSPSGFLSSVVAAEPSLRLERIASRGLRAIAAAILGGITLIGLPVEAGGAQKPKVATARPKRPAPPKKGTRARTSLPRTNAPKPAVPPAAPLEGVQAEGVRLRSLLDHWANASPDDQQWARLALATLGNIPKDQLTFLEPVLSRGSYREGNFVHFEYGQADLVSDGPAHLRVRLPRGGPDEPSDEELIGLLRSHTLNESEERILTQALREKAGLGDRLDVADVVLIRNREGEFLDRRGAGYAFARSTQNSRPGSLITGWPLHLSVRGSAVTSTVSMTAPADRMEEARELLRTLLNQGIPLEEIVSIWIGENAVGADFVPSARTLPGVPSGMDQIGLWMVPAKDLLAKPSR